jgi:hypothetical protein
MRTVTTHKIGMTTIEAEICDHCGVELTQAEAASILRALFEKEKCAYCGEVIEIWGLHLAHKSKGKPEWYVIKIEFGEHCTVEVKVQPLIEERRRAEFWIAKIHEHCKEKSFPHLFKKKAP